MIRTGDGDALVELRVASTDGASIAALEAAGASVTHVAEELLVVTAEVPTDRLRDVAGVAGVQSVTEVLTPITGAQQAASVGSQAVTPAPCGSVTSEADSHLRALQARNAFGVDGTGVEVGVLSDSYDVAKPPDQVPNDRTDAVNDVASGDLPGPGNPCGRTSPVKVVDEQNGPFNDNPNDMIPDNPVGIDEGRAMAQLIHDVAPGAELSFASAFNGLQVFADNIRALAAQGADVITDDVFYFVEPMYQEGPVGVAYGDVRARGIPSFSSAGNSRITTPSGNDVASYEATGGYRNATCSLPRPTFSPNSCHDFDPGAGVDTSYGITINPGSTLLFDLQWAEPWNGVTTDFDLLLYEGSTLLTPVGNFAGIDDNLVTQRPFELAGVGLPARDDMGQPNSPVALNLVVNRFSLTGTPRFKFVTFTSGPDPTNIEYPVTNGPDVVGPSITGHSASPNTFSTAAVEQGRTDVPEPFSSQGPATFLFGPVRNEAVVPGAAAPPLPSPLILDVPDASATDGAANTFFFKSRCPNPGDVCRFFGTSAAAPHAAGVAALMLDRNPGLAADTVDQILRDTAVPLSGGPARGDEPQTLLPATTPESQGHGLINAEAAVGAVPAAPAAVIPEAPLAALLPLLAGGAMAAGVAVRRRRAASAT